MKSMNEPIFLNDTVVRSVSIDETNLINTLTDIKCAEIVISHDKGNDIMFYIASDKISDHTMIKFLKAFDRYRPLCKQLSICQLVKLAKDLAAEKFEIESYNKELRDAEDVSEYLQLPDEHEKYTLRWKKSLRSSAKIVKEINDLTTKDEKIDEYDLQIIKDLTFDEIEHVRWLNLSISTDLFSREVSITKFRDMLLAIELTGSQNSPKASLHYSAEEYQSQLVRTLIRLYGKERLIHLGIIKTVK